MAIRSFQTKEIQRFFETGKPPKKAGWRSIAKVAMRKLDMIQYAGDLEDLRSPPSNRLEALKGNFRGFYSIRINNQWRIIFKWKKGAEEVHIIDYH